MKHLRIELITRIRDAKRFGFSLIELLIVVAIISVLATVVALNLGDAPSRARIAKARAEIEILCTGLKIYRMDQGHYPSQGQGLDALCRIPIIEPIPAHYPQGGYIEGSRVPTDPWGNPYVYLNPGRDGDLFEVISYGADGEPEREGEGDDFSSSFL